jgi:hypothetical protein
MSLGEYLNDERKTEQPQKQGAKESSAQRLHVLQNNGNSIENGLMPVTREAACTGH